MTLRNRIAFSSVAVALLVAGGTPSPAQTPQGKPDMQGDVRTASAGAIDSPRPVIQIALLLDTSGSMEGLINQARSRLWDVINVLGTARKDGRRPEFQVALYQYGSDRLPSGEGFLTMVQPFTTDLDLLSERLFALSVGGSAEYCGQVMDCSLRQLSWSATPASAPIRDLPLRVILIAGNEEFTQGPVDYRSPVAGAKQRGVIINTIYCGLHQEGEATGWLSAAHLGGGAYNAIDHNQRVAEIACPQDDELMRLNEELNATYIPYGRQGSARKQMQTMQDSANVNLSKSGQLSRIAAKGGASYMNSHWDLVDACDGAGFDLAAVSTIDLPEKMRPMTVIERRAYVASMKDKRESIRARIAALTAERGRFLAEQRAKGAHGETLDSAIVRAVMEQARRAGFTFTAD